MNELAKLEYAALQQEKHDKMNARLQVWSLLVALVSGFGLASFQTGAVSYLVGVYPLLSACLARYTGHSEAVLDQIKAYLLTVEHANGYQGYERFNLAHVLRHVGSGGHKKALRDALLLTDALAVVAIETRLFSHGWVWLAVMVAVCELVALLATWCWLQE